MLFPSLQQLLLLLATVLDWKSAHRKIRSMHLTIAAG